jgi:virginiamycin B lyase
MKQLLILFLFSSCAFAQELPPGKARELVRAQCTTCHAFRVGSGYTAEGWNTVMRMMDNFGVNYSAAQRAEILEYLIANFPEKDKPKGVVLPGPAKVTMQAWQVPQPGSRPHDPLAARDGSLWYTGQMTNVLGRVDPKTGEVREFPLKSKPSGPHGLDEDRRGNIWYTGNAAGLIGKLDPKTGEVTEYKVPGVRDPHTLIFDYEGMLWFTAQNANIIGRLEPQTGDIRLLPSPSANSRPYGMAVGPRGDIFIVLFGVNKVARVDPATLRIREYALPDPKSRPRRIAITRDSMVWYTDYPRGFLGRLDPSSGKVTEWQSPSGPRSEPYGISAIGEAIWYSESGTTPNTVVRFDPKAEKFQSWAIPGGGNIVRNTSVTREGDFVLANSLTNQVTLVKIEK